MRILKRLRLLSSLSSDPPLNNPSPLVQLKLQQDEQQLLGLSNLHSERLISQKSHPPNQASNGHLTGNPTWVSRTKEFVSSSKNSEGLESNEEEQDGKVEKKTSKNDIIIRKECTFNQEVNISSLAPVSTPFDQGHQYSNSEWKSNTNEKSTMYEDDDNLKLLAKITEVYVGDGFGNGSSSSTTNSKRKKIRGNVLLEGSRCSRKNGRGWRCCQPTLVGYALCEHHLGKGRLRTMSNVTARNRKQSMMGTSANAPKDDDEQTQEQPTWLRRINREKGVVGIATEDEKHDDRYNNDDDDDDEKELSQFTMNKTKRLGKVRARSMSSLLVAIDNATMGASQQLPKQ